MHGMANPEGVINEKVSRIINRIRRVIGLGEFVEVTPSRDGKLITIKIEVPVDRVNFVSTHSGYIERERKRILAFTMGIYNTDGIHIIRLWLSRNTMLVEKSIRTRDLTDCFREMYETGAEWCKDYEEKEVGRMKLRVRRMEFNVVTNNSPAKPLVTAYVWIHLPSPG